jgi:site-specific DNA-methyltransferase (adenine-specific)
MNIDECQMHGINPTNILEFGFQKNEMRIHEAQKPLKLIQFLIRLTTKEGQTVLDPFMGSGTTAVAAKQLKRHFIGFEVIQEFRTGALERLDRETGSQYSPEQAMFQPMLFEKPKKKYGN